MNREEKLGLKGDLLNLKLNLEGLLVNTLEVARPQVTVNFDRGTPNHAMSKFIDRGDRARASCVFRFPLEEEDDEPPRRQEVNRKATSTPRSCISIEKSRRNVS